MGHSSTPDEDAARDLVERVSRGDQGAIEQVLVEELPRLRAFVRLNVDAVLRARESCSDLVQSVCREVLEALPDFEYRGRAAFRGYLCAWTMNKIRDRRRFHLAARRDLGREVSAIPDLAGVFTPSEQAARREELERVEAAFDRLSPAQREVLTLSRIAGLSHAEIAERTGRQQGAVRVLLHKALARLATVLDSLRDGSSR
ncbi:MAG: sigma-70 family RNA polymerase sigma factor [Planctomycetes bacterium]|nr:sigma-70 family RNA polymerase sigma factor [Planctomycetota bacterium]